MELTRRELFIATAATAAAAACGGDDGGDSPTIDAPSSANCLANGTRANIGSNHGHTLDVSAGDVSAGSARTYDITGSADHAHSVTLSEAQMATLAGNGSVSVSSTGGGGHSHSITITCR